MRQKEECLLHWQSVLSEKEFKLESKQDNLSHLMSELRIKDSLLAEKDNIIGSKEREMDIYFISIINWSLKLEQITPPCRLYHEYFKVSNILYYVS